MRKTIFKINKYAHYISCLTVIALMFLTVGDIGKRILFNKSIVGTYELTGPLLTIMVFLAFGYAELYKDHVVIDFVYNHMPAIIQKIVSYAISVIYTIIVLTMCLRVFIYGIAMMSSGAETSNLQIPHWPFILVGGVGLICYFLSVLCNYFPDKEGGAYINDVD